MNGLLLFFAAHAATINDICADPVVDPRAPYPACVIETRQQIKTEHFSVTIEPRQVLHFYNEGRSMEIMPSIRQSPILIAIEVDRASAAETVRQLGFYNCPNAVLEQGKLLRCERRLDDGYVTRLYAGLRGTHVVTVEYSRSAPVESDPGQEEKFELMLASIELNAP